MQRTFRIYKPSVKKRKDKILKAIYVEKKKEKKNISMLNKEIINLINEQIWLENHASFYYLKLSIKFSIEGFGGIVNFFTNNPKKKGIIC